MKPSRTFIASAGGLHRIASSFPGCIAQSFVVNNFTDFLDVVRVQKNKDFLQSLVAFHYSNICYLIDLTEN